jgi:glyoxylase-like metal-dependent hydrolase (beta-lactamase superfamily II)
MTVDTIIAPNGGPYTLDGTRTYIVAGRIVVDPGPDIASHVEAIVSAAPHLDTIALTHRHSDHAPAARALKARTGARLVAPAGVLADLVDRVVRDGDRIESGEAFVSVIGTPGHTREHVCYLTPDGDLFTGDTILGEGTTAIFPPDGRMGDYLASLGKLRALAPRRIFPGHGPRRDDAVAWIDHYIEHRRGRERQISALLRERPLTIPRLRLAIYPDLPGGLQRAAELQLEAHLTHMVERGEVIVDGELFAIS